MPEYQRTWGFRLSAVDMVVLALTGPATWWAWPQVGELAGVIPSVVGHFFLFCNVFRIIRWKELLWTGMFLVNVTWWTIFADCSWLGILVIQTPLTLMLIISELFTRRYHGIWARRLNIHLDDYLAGRELP
ncbi:MAG TPA: hypothetical protein VHX44_03625 [Planctomycetota bacterium]|jgi:hypothetical protein|nr:hypothetical protein [Planctomycetota bacterium]